MLTKLLVMAFQVGNILLSGTIGGITFYKREGQWLARKKTSLDKKRVSTDPAFKNSRAAANTFGKGSKLAKIIYEQLPPEKKLHGVFGKITGFANRLLAQGCKQKEAKQKLQQQFFSGSHDAVRL